MKSDQHASRFSALSLVASPKEEPPAPCPHSMTVANALAHRFALDMGKDVSVDLSSVFIPGEVADGAAAFVQCWAYNRSRFVAYGHLEKVEHDLHFEFRDQIVTCHLHEALLPHVRVGSRNLRMHRARVASWVACARAKLDVAKSYTIRASMLPPRRSSVAAGAADPPPDADCDAVASGVVCDVASGPSARAEPTTDAGAALAKPVTRPSAARAAVASAALRAASCSSSKSASSSSSSSSEERAGAPGLEGALAASYGDGDGGALEAWLAEVVDEAAMGADVGDQPSSDESCAHSLAPSDIGDDGHEVAGGAPPCDAAEGEDGGDHVADVAEEATKMSLREKVIACVAQGRAELIEAKGRLVEDETKESTQRDF